jgi:hypothetical protein
MLDDGRFGFVAVRRPKAEERLLRRQIGIWAEACSHENWSRCIEH